MQDAVIEDDENYDKGGGGDFLSTPSTSTSIDKTSAINQHENHEEDQEFPTAISTSYETLLLLAAGAVHQMREEYFNRSTDYHCNISVGDGIGSSENNNSAVNETVTFAVTIPEGPMLPLSILVVHALNVGLQHQQPYSSSAALVPMDLDEGRDRNSHILNDARPSFALTVPGKDSQKLQELIDVKSDKNSNSDNSADTSPDRVTRIVDFVDLVKVARRRLLSQLSKVASDCLSSASVQPNFQSSYYSQLISSSTATTLQGLVSQLASDIIILSSDSTDKPRRFQSNAKENKEGQPSKAPNNNKISHIVYTSGTTGRPKGCTSSTRSLLNYIAAKNKAHDISEKSTVLLASALSFDPCLSDILAAFDTRANLAIAPRDGLISGLTAVLQELKVTHILCTPTLWSLTLLHPPSNAGDSIKESYPHIQRVALGGEPIPKSLVQAWARSHRAEHQLSSSCRLLATYGVTEACVYQTCGEIFRGGLDPGQWVGHTLQGTRVKICREEIQDGRLVEVSEAGMNGEIILFGDQVDACTRYLNRPDLDAKFVTEVVASHESNDNDGTTQNVRHHYRTGDRGCISQEDGSLTILGRIVGEEGMIKINGVRVELGEIEAALMSDDNDNDGNSDESTSSIVTDCLVKFIKDPDGQSVIHAYCVLREETWRELGILQGDAVTANEGIIISGGPLWTLLRTKCSNRLRKACIPSAFVGIRRLPLSRTGKRDRLGLPALESCSVVDISNKMSNPLQDYGVSGGIVFETLVHYLNLQPCQQKMVTKSVSFAALGGDSLSAVVVCRTLYAHFHQIENSRFIGGDYGTLSEPFDTATLLQARNLGDYVDLLDSQNGPTSDSRGTPLASSGDTDFPAATTSMAPAGADNITSDKALLYDALLQATTLNQSSIAASLLNLGADPNYGHNHKNRIGNTSTRRARRAVFKAAPLHLACFRGDPGMVELLLKHGASYKSPNTNGQFPIHLAAAATIGLGDDEGSDSNIKEEEKGDESRRLECVRLLLDAGCPVLMKDASNQSILHAAARAGHRAILEHVIAEHRSDRYDGPVPLRQFLDFRDKWHRSAVHWATLHGNVRALELLLEKGSDPSPYKPRSTKYTSMIVETPLELCRRLHGSSEAGTEMERLLIKAIDST